MLTRRGAFRQRGMDLPKIQTNITAVEVTRTAATTTTPAYDCDADLARFIQVDDSCLDFLAPTSGGSGSTATPESAGSTPQAGGGGGGEVPWPRPMDRDIHGRSNLKHTAPQWAIRVRWVLSMDFDEQDPSGWGGAENTALCQLGRKPSVVDTRHAYGRKIRGGRGRRRPSDFSLRGPPRVPGGLQVRYEDIPLELVICSEEEDSLYTCSN
ncbi:hypothetical protein diail_8697 [Diaporthe ilicicola]|nr:hypothetical protein diail_8697 [Diaporthe ilicicola]